MKMTGGMQRKLLVGGAVVVAGVGIFCLLAGIRAYATYAEFQPYFSAKDDVVRMGNRGVVLLDRNDRPFFTLYQPRLITYVPLSDMPVHLQQAAIAAEDHRFYEHPGFSWRAIARSAWVDIRHRTLLSGGSTITQQLVKNSLLTREKSFTRKFKELVLAVALERHFTKSDILEMYLNTAYFGQGAVGVENAAQHFFGKEVGELTESEAHFLVALLPSPSALLTNEEHLLARQKYVAARLGKPYSPLTVADMPEATAAGATSGVHFALMVKQELLGRFGEDTLTRSGFTVKTTLDLDKQEVAERIVAQDVQALRRSNVHNGAAVVLNPKTGEVLSLVGSRDWNDERWGKVNMAVTPRQTGSAFKPIVYATAFEQRVASPATVLQDKPTTFGTDYKPENYDKRFRGPVTVRRALANSLNVPAVQMMSQVGVGGVVAAARDFGISTLTSNEEHLALALGAGEVPLLELTGAYGVLANEGEYVKPHLILEVRDKLGKVAPGPAVESRSVLSRGAAYLTTSILSDARAGAEVFGGALYFPRPAAVKTGTTQNYRDAWTVGFTPRVAVGVWIGNNDNAPMHSIAGALGAAPIWKKLMTEFTRGEPYEQFMPPPEVFTKHVCGRSEYFLPGMSVPKTCPMPRPSPAPSPGPEIAGEKEEKPKKEKPRSRRDEDDGWEEITQWDRG